MDTSINTFLIKCYSQYLSDIKEKVKGFPENYCFPDGNPVLPVLPVQVQTDSIMIIGAFPSARFERRKGVLIPVANNLSPFAEEEYFDGREIRKQSSRESLNKNYFPQLGINPKDIWLTDLVKIYLFPEKHIKNCKFIAPTIQFCNTHKLFKQIAEASQVWIHAEIIIANPKLIITLGEIPARVIRADCSTENKTLLNGKISKIKIADSEFNIASLAHPEIRRINSTWNNLTEKAIKILKQEMNNSNL